MSASAESAVPAGAGPEPGSLPMRPADRPRPVRPKDSASMLVLRRGPRGIEALMGRRGRKAVFNDVWVFPGGKVDRADRAAVPATDLDAELRRRLSSDPARGRVFALAAVRETFEETGLVLGAPGDPGGGAGESWARMRALGLAPDLAKLGYVGHAITPASRAVRFNARFFSAWADDLSGELGGSGELEDLAFLPARDALDLPLVDVTKFMLEETLRREAAGFPAPAAYPFFGYRKERPNPRYR